MKPLFRVLVAATLTTATTSCESFLDINQNPNQATSVNPDALLASALVVTAANYMGGAAAGGQNYNSYSSFAAGYWGKSGTVSGFAEEQSYNYTSNYQQNLFNTTYDNLNDYNIIQMEGMTKGYPNHAAIARIMKVYNFLLLVDQYGDIPYTDALKGLTKTSPSYDKAADIYKDFIVQLKGVIKDINTAEAADARHVGGEDVVFSGNMTRWKQFANSLRLRILLRESSTNDGALNSYVATEMTALKAEADGFIDRDVVVQPGFTGSANQQNPFFNTYGFAPGLTTRATATYSFILPTNYIIEQYVRNNDPRITQLYRRGQRNIKGTITATRGYVGTNLGESQPPQFDPTDGATVGSRFLNPEATLRPLGGTFLRGANAPTVLMLLAEHLFSKSEAENRGLLPGGDAKQDYFDGIKASFLHTYRVGAAAPATLAAATTANAAGVAEYNTYITANAANGLVDWDANSTTVREGTDKASTPTPDVPVPTMLTTPRAVSTTEKVLYQKYLAENTVASTEAWADYRRTAQPMYKISQRAGVTKLPTRLFYPQTEVSTNAANVPKGVDQFTKIFWDVVD